MDEQLRQLKRATLSSPDDATALHRYINALERVVGGVEPATLARQGWKCLGPVRLLDGTPSYQPWLTHSPHGRSGSPDGICVYFSQSHILCERSPGEGPCGPGCHRVVSLIIDGEEVEWRLPLTYTGDNESDDWCIFCGEPEERK